MYINMKYEHIYQDLVADHQYFLFLIIIELGNFTKECRYDK